MAIFFIKTSGDPDDLVVLEERVRAEITDFSTIDSVEQLTGELGERVHGGQERHIILFPVAPHDTRLFDRILNIAARYRERLFFILISDAVSAADYKRLVRTGAADWVSTANAPDEIRDILRQLWRGEASHAVYTPPSKPTIVVFVPCAGGVGNATIATELAVQVKTNKATRERKVCLVDLDFQTSHICDLLDMDAALNIEELLHHPERLDDHLFSQFLCTHSCGLDVLAAPRSKMDLAQINIATLDVLFGAFAERYELVLIDLPLTWFSWTRQVVGVADLAVVVTTNEIPRLRQAADTLAAINELNPRPNQVRTVVNRCEARLLGGAAEGPFVRRILGSEQVFLVRDDADGARQSANTGIPLAIGDPSSRIAKDLAPLRELITMMKPKTASA